LQCSFSVLCPKFLVGAFNSNFAHQNRALTLSCRSPQADLKWSPTYNNSSSPQGPFISVRGDGGRCDVFRNPKRAGFSSRDGASQWRTRQEWVSYLPATAEPALGSDIPPEWRSAQPRRHALNKIPPGVVSTFLPHQRRAAHATRYDKSPTSAAPPRRCIYGSSCESRP